MMLGMSNCSISSRAHCRQLVTKLRWSNKKQAHKPLSYTISKLRPSDRVTGVKCRASSVFKESFHLGKKLEEVERWR